MYPGIFDETFANAIYDIATAMIPTIFVIVSLALVLKLIKSVMP